MELIKWKEAIRRLAELNKAPPDLMLTYRAMESIFSVVIDKAEPQPHARWMPLKNEFGRPHSISQLAVEKVAAFADAALGALALIGNSNQNPGLPLTDNQKARSVQIKDADKKRAAAAKVKAEPPPVTNPEQPKAAAVIKKSATCSMWAKPCNDWAKTGECSRGISCLFAHPGFNTTQNRCITCGKKNHSSKECTAPGGGAGPNRDAVWTEYRKCKKANAPAGKGGGKGDKGGKGKGKGQGGGKGGKGKDAKAKAAVDYEVSRASAAVTPAAFPRLGIGLDSWANVQSIHRKPHKGSVSKDILTP